jgi:hypothetical protein
MKVILATLKVIINYLNSQLNYKYVFVNRNWSFFLNLRECL